MDLTETMKQVLAKVSGNAQGLMGSPASHVALLQQHHAQQQHQQQQQISHSSDHNAAKFCRVNDFKRDRKGKINN